MNPPEPQGGDPARDLEYVGFRVRFGAFVIDSLLMGLIVMPLAQWIFGRTDVESLKLVTDSGELLSWTALEPSGPGDLLVSWVLPIIAVLLFWIARQATPGKMLFSARIVDATTGGKPSSGQMVGRYFAYYVSILGLFLGFAWIIWDARKQGWHDKLAGTVVVRPRKRGPEAVKFAGDSARDDR